MSDNRWHQVAYVYDQSASGFIALYLDGTLSRSNANTGAWSWDPAEPIELGRSHDAYWRRYNGLLDDFRMLNRILTAAEIAQAYAGDGGIPAADIGANLQGDMLHTNASAFVRIPFVVDNPGRYTVLTLRLKYDDGFVAWINGEEVARANAADPLAWDAAATQAHAASLAESITFGNVDGLLRAGTNLLALQGLNVSATNGTFLILPELTATTTLAETTNGVYFITPTPGAANLGGAATPGPSIREVQHTPVVPRDSDDLLVTARVEATFNAVSNAVAALSRHVQPGSQRADERRRHRRRRRGGRWPLERAHPRRAPAPAARWSGIVSPPPMSAPTPRAGRSTPIPPAPPQYLGTVVASPALTSKLPIYQLFVQNAAAADTRAGARASFFYNGEFYDNVFIRLKGGTTAGLEKKSHRIDFNREHEFLFDSGYPRQRELALNAEYVDPTYLRQFMTFAAMRYAGTPAPIHFPVRLQQNGQFYQLAFHTYSQDAEMLELMGLDPDGALYKNCFNMSYLPDPNYGGRNYYEAEKQTRLYEDKSDFTDLAKNVCETNTVSSRRLYLSMT